MKKDDDAGETKKDEARRTTTSPKPQGEERRPRKLTAVEEGRRPTTKTRRPRTRQRGPSQPRELATGVASDRIGASCGHRVLIGLTWRWGGPM